MLIPRFTIRWLLGLTTVCAVIFFVIGFAVRGHYWAIAMSTSVVSLTLGFLVFGLFFVAAFSVAAMFGVARTVRPSGSPFATAEPPPQIVPPEEPE